MASQRRRHRDDDPDVSVDSDVPQSSAGPPSPSPSPSPSSSSNLSSLVARSTSACRAARFPDSPPPFPWKREREWVLEQCYTAVEHGQTFAHMDDVAARARKCRDLPRLTSDTVKAVAKATPVEVLEILNEHPYVCLAFDGSMWKHESADGQHILVTTAQCAKGGYVLPPDAQPKTWTAANVGVVLDRIASDLQETTLKHFIIDVMAESAAPADEIDATAAFFEEVALQSAAPACSYLQQPEKRKLLKALRKQFSEKWLHVPYLLCLGNYVRWQVVDVQTTWVGQGDAADLVANISESLFSLECASARKARLKRFIRVKSQAALVKAVAARSAIADAFKVLRDGLGYIDTRMLRTNIADGIRAFAPHLLDKIDSTQGFFGSDERAWGVPMRVLRGRLDDYIQIMERQSTATRLAADRTQWHFGAFRAYAFTLANLDALQEFYAEETHPTSVLIVDALAQNKEKIRQELQEYVASLAPADQFLTVANSDAKSGMNLQFFASFAGMQRLLSEQRDGTPGRELYKRIAQEVVLDGPEPPRELLPIGSTIKFHFFAQYLQPGYPRYCTHEWFKSRNGVIGAKEFREGLGFTEDELPDSEFDDYWSLCKSDSTLTSCVAAREWWLSQAERFPNLHEVALYVMRVPCITTSFDSAVRVVESMFTPQQNSIDTATAAELVALRCNGDVGGYLPQGTWKTSWS